MIVALCRYNLSFQRKVVGQLFVQGVVGCVIPYTLIAYGQQSVDSALAAILNSTTPLFVFLASAIWTRHERITRGRLFGVTIGLAGVVVIAGASALGGLGETTLGQVAILLATISSAAGVVYGRRLAMIPPEAAAAGTLTGAAILLIPLCFIFEGSHTVPSLSSILALLINAVVATAFGFIVYFRLIHTIGSMSTASVGYLKPACGILIGCLLMGEPFTWTTAIGFTTILAGVAAINQVGSSTLLWLSADRRPGVL